MNSHVMITFSLEEFRTLLSETVKEEIAKIHSFKIEEPPSNGGRKRLTRSELAKKIKRSLPTIDQYTKQGIFTRYKEGSRYFYFEDEAMNAYIEMES